MIRVAAHAVPDQKPPRLESDERETLRALLQYQRDSIVRKATGVDDAAARRPLVGSGTTLLWLIKHLARAETLWIVRRFAGQDVEVPDDQVRSDDSLTSDAVIPRQATSHDHGR